MGNAKWNYIEAVISGSGVKPVSPTSIMVE
jgi:hypothetical protein